MKKWLVFLICNLSLASFVCSSSSTVSSPFCPVGGSGFTPSSISNLKAWYDSTDNTTITAIATKVSAWNDKSGNAINLAQSNASYKFTVNATGINGHQTLTAPYNAGFNALTGMTGNFGADIPAFSFGMLLQPNAVLGTFTSLFATETNTGDLITCTGSADVTKLSGYVNNVGNTGQSATNSFVNGTPYWIFVTYTTNTMIIYANNVQILSTTTNLTNRQLGAIFSVAGSVSGGERAMGADVGDVVVYTSVLSSTDRGNLYTQYIQPRWGLP